MDNSLLQFAYLQYASDTPHENIIQALINKGATTFEAQHILDIATITYCTQNGQTSQQVDSATDDDEGMGFVDIIKTILGIISLILTVIKCVN